MDNKPWTRVYRTAFTKASKQMPLNSCYWQRCWDAVISTQQSDKAHMLVHGVARQRQEQE